MKDNIISQLKILFNITKKSHLYSKSFLFLCAFRLLIDVLNPVILTFIPAFIINEIIERKRVERLLLLVSILVLISLLINIFRALLNKYITIEAENVMSGFDMSVNMALLKTRLEIAEDSKTLGMIQKLNDGKNQVGPITSVLENGIVGLIRNIVNIIVYASIFFHLILSDSYQPDNTFYSNSNSIIKYIVTNTSVFFAFILFLSVIAILYRIKTQKKESKIIEKFSDIERAYSYYTTLRADYQNGADIRVNRLYKLLNARIVEYNKSEKKMHSAIGAHECMSTTIITVITQIQIISMYAFITLKILFGYISLGSFYIYANAIIQFITAISDTIKNANELFYALSFYKVYPILWGLKPDNHHGDKKIINSSDCVITFNHVFFHYPGQKNWVLKDVSFTVNAKEHISIVGKNGAGKSTLIKLLMGLYQPQRGSIYINNIALCEIDKREYYKLFGVAFQDFQLLAATVGSNIAANETYDEFKVWKILDSIGLTKRIKEENGLETKVTRYLSDDGIIFSGGEEQKIAIARALYSNASIIVMDEPMASLDPIAEENINLLLDELSGSKMTIVISHRLSSCKLSDRIFVLDNGKLIETGNHNELIMANSLYAKMWNMQSEYYTKH